jgi:hypothetical protein
MGHLPPGTAGYPVESAVCLAADIDCCEAGARKQSVGRDTGGSSRSPGGSVVATHTLLEVAEKPWDQLRYSVPAQDLREERSQIAAAHGARQIVWFTCVPIGFALAR